MTRSSDHNCDWVEAVLTGESPLPVGSPTQLDDAIQSCECCAALAEALADVDALAASLPELVVPEALSRQTLARVHAEMTSAPTVRRPQQRRWPMLALVGGLSMAAAAMLVIQPNTPSPAPPERLIARGNAASLPTVSLKVAVDEGSGLARHRRNQRYRAGTRIQFRVALDQPADVALLRVDKTGSQLVTRTQLQGGDHDIKLGDAPLAWEVEQGEQDAHFVVLAGPAGSLPVDVDAALPTGTATLDAGGVCGHVTALACDERLFQVSP